ncbi:bifunctional folylpolyglutamate synthase/dihydrofolate synthase [Bacillota bacterium Meth-B3]
MSDGKVQALIEWMYAQRTLGEKAGLDNMRALCAALGHPERALRAVHVAGTNGKGSVCAFLERALRENRLKTGLYTSPYLMRYNERVRLSGRPIPDEALLRSGERVRAAAGAVARHGFKPTTFELGTALAFCAFEEAGVDIAVIETGIGGRLDPTNVIAPEVSVIATIGYDHMDLLGDTLGDIAREKAGILKPSTPAAFYPGTLDARAALDEAARSLGIRVARCEDYPMVGLAHDPYGSHFDIELPALGHLDVRVNLPGAHQAENARLALAALSLLRRQGWALDPRAIEAGLERTVWPGRLEWAEPGLLLDGAHNPQGARALAGYLQSFFKDQPIVLLTGMMKDKQPEAYADVLAPLADRAVATSVDWPRAMDAGALAALYRARGVRAESCPAVAEALERTRKLAETEGGVAVVAGSLYLIGAVRGLLRPNRGNFDEYFDFA